jgi:hypothetical protein
MCRMQEMGSPPEEVMGEMPEGLVSTAVGVMCFHQGRLG